jgi:hypothetical protein
MTKYIIALAILLMSGVTSYDRDDTLIKGDTDQTKIGNVGDRLKVDVAFTSPTTSVPSWSKKLRYEDMNASTGGIARGTNVTGAAFTTLYSYNGTGYIAGILINVETFTDWEFRLEVDGDVIYSLTTTDLTTDTLYDVDDITDVNQAYLGLSKSSHDRFVWHSPLGSPLYYGSNVTVKLKKTAGSKKFQAGLIILSKET